MEPDPYPLRQARVKAQHLPYVSGFLLTGSSWVDKANGSGALIMALGPPRDATMAGKPKPLYYVSIGVLQA